MGLLSTTRQSMEAPTDSEQAFILGSYRTITVIGHDISIESLCRGFKTPMEYINLAYDLERELVAARRSCYDHVAKIHKHILTLARESMLTSDEISARLEALTEAENDSTGT